MHMTYLITPCPSSKAEQSLRLLCSSLPLEERAATQALLQTFLAERQDDPAAPMEGLFVALAGGQVVGAVMVHCLPGRTAVLYPPVAVGAEPRVCRQLASAADDYLVQLDVSMVQCLLEREEHPARPLSRGNRVCQAD